MQYGNCSVLDLFCGKGKNGNENGSPLVLLGQASKVLDIKQIKNRLNGAHVSFWFNDAEKENVDDFEKHLKDFPLHANIKKLKSANENFNDLLPVLMKELSGDKTPKFFFLDPFTYSTISVEQISALFGLINSEILLFLPTFQAYRFATDKSEIPEKLRLFLTAFAEKGAVDYADIEDLNESIMLRLRRVLNTPYVRPVLLDDGSRKHTLFFITKHPIGALVINRIVWKNSSDGSGVLIKETRQQKAEPTLFNMSQVETAGTYVRLYKFEEQLLDQLRARKAMDNTEIFSFTVSEGFLPRHAVSILRNLKNKIRVAYKDPLKNKGFYVSEECWDQIRCDVHYQEKE